MVREAREEIGVDILEKDLRVCHVMHRKSEEERIDFFLSCTNWDGIVQNMEPNKCDDLSWFLMDELPENIIPYVKTTLEMYQEKRMYSEFGWS